MSDTADREIVNTRVFNAPREKVFDVWTDTTTVSRWWGPNGFTTTTHEANLKVGGVWRFTMHGPDGVDYPNRITYREIVRPERLVYDHDADGSPPQFVAFITFADVDGKTEVTLRTILPTAEIREEMVKFGAVEGGRQTLERLGEFLAG